MNLLRETIKVLKEYNKEPKDVEWVGTNDGYITWDKFKKLADRNYDNGYGGEEVNIDLVVVGKDWWLERHEYDGSEWWEYKTLPQKPKKANFTQIASDKFDNEGELFIFLV